MHRKEGILERGSEGKKIVNCIVDMIQLFLGVRPMSHHSNVLSKEIEDTGIGVGVEDPVMDVVLAAYYGRSASNIAAIVQKRRLLGRGSEGKKSSELHHRNESGVPGGT